MGNDLKKIHRYDGEFSDDFRALLKSIRISPSANPNTSYAVVPPAVPTVGYAKVRIKFEAYPDREANIASAQASITAALTKAIRYHSESLLSGDPSIERIIVRDEIGNVSVTEQLFPYMTLLFEVDVWIRTIKKSSGIAADKKIPVPEVTEAPVPVQTLTTWRGSHPSPEVVPNPKAGDYGYFTKQKKNMYYDGTTWIPVSEFLDKHNKVQVSMAFQAEKDMADGKNPGVVLPPGVEASQLKIIGAVKYLGELVELPTPEKGNLVVCLENGKLYLFNGGTWVLVEAPGPNPKLPSTVPLISKLHNITTNIVIDDSKPDTPTDVTPPTAPEDIFGGDRVIRRKRTQ